MQIHVYAIDMPKLRVLYLSVIFLCRQTTDKDAPSLVRIQTLAYLSGFPASFKETEQLRIKLPSVVTSKIKQVRIKARIRDR